MVANSSLGPLERKVMKCVWEHEQKTVREVYDCLKQHRSIAYTTVMTLMTRLVEKGFLSRKKEGKAYTYFPRKNKKQAAQAVIKRMISSLVDQFGKEAVVAFTDELDYLSIKKLKRNDESGK